MLPESLSAEGEQRCRRLLAGATARYRARPAAAAVLVPLCLVRGAPALLYTLRSSRLAGRHKGDVRYTVGTASLLRKRLRSPEGGRHFSSPRLGFRLCKMVSQVASVIPLTRMWCTQPCGRHWKRSAWPCLNSRCGGSCTPCPTSKKPLWCPCSPAWAPWTPRASDPTWRRWMRCLRCPWPTCCRHRIRAIPTSASVVTSGTHCLSSCTGHTASGGSQLSSPSSPCSCWHQAPTSPDWLAFRCPGAEDLAPAAPTFAWPGWFHSRTE